MKRLMGLMAVGVAVLVVSIAPRQVSADFTVCNQFRQLVYVAYGYDDGLDWVSEGWWPIDPGHCTALFQGPLIDRYVYIYGEIEDRSLVWSGNAPFCVEPNNDFTIWGNYDCHVNFIEIDTGGAADYTFTLTP